MLDALLASFFRRPAPRVGAQKKRPRTFLSHIAESMLMDPFKKMIPAPQPLASSRSICIIPRMGPPAHDIHPPTHVCLLPSTTVVMPPISHQILPMLFFFFSAYRFEIRRFLFQRKYSSSRDVSGGVTLELADLDAVLPPPPHAGAPPPPHGGGGGVSNEAGGSPRTAATHRRRSQNAEESQLDFNRPRPARPPPTANKTGRQSPERGAKNGSPVPGLFAWGTSTAWGTADLTEVLEDEESSRSSAENGAPPSGARPFPPQGAPAGNETRSPSAHPAGESTTSTKVVVVPRAQVVAHNTHSLALVKEASQITTNAGHSNTEISVREGRGGPMARTMGAVTTNMDDVEGAVGG